MKITNLTDNLLSNDRYESFKEVMEAHGATFTATELKHGTNAMQLRGCRVEYEDSVEMTEFDPSKEKLSKHDFDADWQQILKSCAEFGFQPK